MITATVDAPWLPAGSTAEVWSSSGTSPEPAVIVRLFLTDGHGPRRFFCVGTDRGLDLPTLFLGHGERGVDGWNPLGDGIARLTRTIVGASVATRCVGYVRNVVPRPDDAYLYPTPYAHVPVVTPVVPVEPVVVGTWVSVPDGSEALSVRHWWPIVEHLFRRPSR